MALPVLQPVAEDPDGEVRCRAMQLLIHLLGETPKWAEPLLAIISSVSLSSIHLVNARKHCALELAPGQVCVAGSLSCLMSFSCPIPQVLQNGLDKATQCKAEVCCICCHHDTCPHFSLPPSFPGRGRPKASSLKGSHLRSHTALQGTLTGALNDGHIEPPLPSPPLPSPPRPSCTAPVQWLPRCSTSWLPSCTSTTSRGASCPPPAP